MAALATASEIILPIGTQKHDPAWQHCLMVRSNGRTRLKCMYCLKQFLGGGIHRIKEHLAKHKGNASCCPKVPSEVQLAMQQSLEGAAVRKKRKLRLAEEVRRLNPNQAADPAEIPEAGLPMISSMPENMLEITALQVDVKEEGGAGAETKVRGKRKRSARHSSSSLPPPHPALPLNEAEAVLPIAESGPPSMVDKDQVYMAIARFLYEAGAPLDSVNSVFFQPMVNAIALAGPGLQLPSYHDFRGCILKRSIGDVNSLVEHYKGTWSRTGCSVLADEWTTETGKTLMNFLIYCPEGTMFLRSVDASHIVTSVDTLYELLKHVVEEVGERNVVQLITHNTETHAIAGKRLTECYPTMFWTPCASQSIDAMLEDIAKVDVVSEIIENAKTITGFIYNHGTVLNMMRKYTSGRDLLLPSETHAAMNFITLKSMTSLKDELRAMVASDEWNDSPLAHKPAGITVVSLIGSFDFWSFCATVVRITEPLLHVFKLADSNKRPAMGYIHVGLYHAKEVIKRELVKKSGYMLYWNIIDWRWNRQLPRPLHAAGFFLNPRFFYSIQGEVSNEISSGMLDCIERLVPEVKIQDKIQKELSMYKSAAGDFGRKMAIRARHTLLPAEWWSTYGGACPNLTRLAIRILSQTCSTRGCERNHIPFEQIHNQHMNYLEHQRFRDLIFVRYNLRLQQRKLLRSKPYDPISVDNIDIVDDWIMEKNELLSAEDEDSSWLVLDQPVANTMPVGYPNDEDVDTFLAELDAEVIRRAGQDAEEDETKDEDD